MQVACFVVPHCVCAVLLARALVRYFSKHSTHLSSVRLRFVCLSYFSFHFLRWLQPLQRGPACRPCRPLPVLYFKDKALIRLCCFCAYHGYWLKCQVVPQVTL